MGDYVLHIELDDAVIANASSDTLCIARKVNNAYTVIFASGSVVPKKPEIKRMTDHSKFEWKDKYQVFFAAKYKAGLLVWAVIIKYDSKEGKLNPATGQGDNSGSFTVTGSPGGEFRVAVEFEANGVWTPIFVDHEPRQGDPTTVLTPKHEYALYWSNSSETTSMIAKTRTPSYTISFGEEESSKTLRYGYTAKDQKDGNEQFNWYEYSTSVFFVVLHVVVLQVVQLFASFDTLFKLRMT
ncbi:hypothetical protein TWF102_000369 [Orbilia oligospora]|uniref:Uncharacterized protein n=1 Tax=Orbilia oligospora TaxID=2813651 RepID=A0A7C8JEZ9_ORBOL|nr:hypothetical protein TWF102_000369 [Orbilia oligospora]